jgi:hypothetical protein
MSRKPYKRFIIVLWVIGLLIIGFILTNMYSRKTQALPNFPDCRPEDHANDCPYLNKRSP